MHKTNKNRNVINWGWVFVRTKKSEKLVQKPPEGSRIQEGPAIIRKSIPILNQKHQERDAIAQKYSKGDGRKKSPSWGIRRIHKPPVKFKELDKRFARIN